VSRPVVSFPHLGDYGVAFEPVGELFGEVVAAPPMTRRTIELGAAHSPEAACLPFKITLGNLIEALENGADVLVQAGGGCRLGLYGEVQEAILRELGYEFSFLSLSNHSTSLPRLMREFRRIEPRNSRRTVARALDTAWARIEALDRVQDLYLRRQGHAEDPSAVDRAHGRFLRELDEAWDRGAIEAAATRCEAEIGRLSMPGRDDVLRVGVVGEVYVAIEPFANHRLERELTLRGVEVHRPVTVSHVLEAVWGGREYVRRLLDSAAPYLSYDVGIDGTKSVAHANRFLREGFDGVVHVKPFGCMPEVSAMPALQRLSRENEFPVLCLSFDVHGSETGTLTRIEAFCDMLRMRRGRSRRAAAEPG
jgi:predicted nucleotide-binding protein (sugar kinase/HSP70/actin superfamily)